MKQFMISLIVFALALGSFSFVAAQDAPPAPDGEEVTPPDGGPADGQRGPRGRHGGKGLDVVAEALDMEENALRDALIASDRTLAEFIEAEGGDVETIRAAMIEDATTRINERYADDAEALEDHLADLEDRIDGVLDRVFEARPERDGRGGPRDGRGNGGPRNGQGGPGGPNGPDAPDGEVTAPEDDAA
jgi:hypothetical protein